MPQNPKVKRIFAKCHIAGDMTLWLHLPTRGWFGTQRPGDGDLQGLGLEADAVKTLASTAGSIVSTTADHRMKTYRARQRLKREATGTPQP